MYFKRKLLTRDMKTPKRFWGYMEGNSLTLIGTSL